MGCYRFRAAEGWTTGLAETGYGDIVPGYVTIRVPATPRHCKEIAVEEQEIQDKVISIVAEQMGVDKGEINRDTNFVNDLNADSLDTVELVMEFEDEFETSIPDEEAEKIQTVGQAIDYIKEHVSKTT